MTDGVATAAAAKPVVTGLGGAFMISAEAKAAGKDGGYRGWQLYVAGRAGVLGEVSTEVVHAALGFMHPDKVRAGWEGGLAVAPLPDTVARYVEVCRSWGRTRYAGLAGADRLADLLDRVAAAADPAGWPLFAAWRAQPLPDDAPGRVVQLLHVLREHRGGAHLGAVRSVGLRPLEAILAGYGGAGQRGVLRLAGAAARGHRRAARPAGPGRGGHRRPGRPGVRRAGQRGAGRPAAAARGRRRGGPRGSLSAAGALSTRRAARFRVTLENDDFCL